MLRLFTKGDDGTLLRSEPTGLDEVPAAGWRWLDVSAPDVEQIVAIGTAFGIHPVNIEDVVEPTLHPKLDVHEDYVFVVLHALAFRGERIASHELDAVVLEDLLITFHRDEIPALEWVIEQAGESAVMAAGGADRMLGRVCEAVARRYLPLLEELEERIDDLEERAMAADPSVVQEVLVLRRDAVTLRKVLAPMRDTAHTLARIEHPLVTGHAKRRFGDVSDHTTRAADSVDAARVLLGSVLDTHRSTVAERTNAAMQTLTVFAAILLPLSLIAGIYGMNFSRMPELEWRWAYFAVLGVMAAVALGLWIHFSRRGLISRPRLRRIPARVVRGLGHGMRGVAGLGIAPVRIVLESFRGRPPNESPPDPYNGPRQRG